MTAVLRISPEQLHALREHLFAGEDEQAAFGLARWEPDGGGGVFHVDTLELVSADGFTFQSSYHIELSSETQARLIKLAFDRHASLVEFHSHRTSYPARFSPSDFHGFEEFVPHVRWRLGGRPYAAVVFHQSSIDGLAWVDDACVQLDRVESDGAAPLKATALSARTVEYPYDR